MSEENKWNYLCCCSRMLNNLKSKEMYYGNKIKEERTNNGVSVSFNVLGCTKDDVVVTGRDDGTLVIHLEEKDYYPEQTKHYVDATGKLEMPKAKAKIKGGILTIDIPFKGGYKTKTIEIEEGG